MSRTKRRKRFGKGKFPYAEWITHDWIRNGPSWAWERKSLEGNELVKSINRFHSDAGVGDRWPVPAWFRREHERIHRSKMNAETRKILKRAQSGDLEIDDDNYIPLKRDIQWEWW
jgi:hypothetical protein